MQYLIFFFGMILIKFKRFSMMEWCQQNSSVRWWYDTNKIQAFFNNRMIQTFINAISNFCIGMILTKFKRLLMQIIYVKDGDSFTTHKREPKRQQTTHTSIFVSLTTLITNTTNNEQRQILS